MDIVICVAYKDCFFLKKNLYFITKNLSPENIYIITNKSNFGLFKKINNEVILIDEDRMIPGLNYNAVKTVVRSHLGVNLAGWYFQQFLKMAFSLTEYAKESYLVWDSDTVPLNPISFSDTEGRYLFSQVKDYRVAYFDTIDRLFIAHQKSELSFICEHMVIDVAIMKELISVIANANLKNCEEITPWYLKCVYAVTPGCFQNQGFSEFETYGTYCLNYYPEKVQFRALRTFRKGGLIYGTIASKREINSLKDILDTCSFELYTYPVSIHRRWIQRAFYTYCRIKQKYLK